MRRNISARTVLNFIAYIALILISVTLVFVKLLKTSSFTNALGIVAESLAYFLVILTSFGYAKSKRNLVWMAGWVIFSVLLIVMVVLVN